MRKINSSNENTTTSKRSNYKAFLIFSIFLIIMVILGTIDSRELNKVDQETSIDITKKEHSIQTLEVDLDNSLETIKSLSNIPEEDIEFLFVSTLDGYIHAYSSKTNKELWKINLGKPLINSNVNPSNFVLEQNSIIPGLDGNIYLYSANTSDNLLKKIEIPLKTLIDNSPFTLPNLSKYIFIGDKKSSMYSIDIKKGTVVSKFSNGEESLMHKRPIQSNNILTVIRIDYTLICLNEQHGNQVWNVTVSEVMAIQKGSKSEISIRTENYHDTITDKLNQIQLANKLDNLIENNPNLNSIVSVHKYNINNDMPVKIYDVKPELGKGNSKSNFIDFFKENYGNIREKTFFPNNTEYKDYLEWDDDRNFYNVLSNYLKWTKERVMRNGRNNRPFFQYLIFKFWEMYYFEEFFFVYLTIIFFLLILIVILITIIIKYIRTNKKLTRKYNRIRKNSEDKRAEAQVALKNDGEDFNKTSDIDDVEIFDTTMALAVYKPYENYLGREDYFVTKEKLEKEEEKNTNAINCLNDKSKLIRTMHKIENETLFKHQFDLGLKNYQIANQAMINVKTYIDNDGSLVQEEQRVIKTKYENNPEVENKIEELKNQLNIINKRMDGDASYESKDKENFEKRKAYIRRQRVNSYADKFEDKNDFNISSDDEFKSTCSSNKKKRNNSTAHRNTQNKLELNFSFLAKQHKNEMQIVIKNSDRESKLKTDKSEIKLIQNNSKTHSKNNNNSININKPIPIINNSNAINLYSKNRKPKYKCKEYNIVNNESIRLKINTTYIDEDRLDKNFEAIEKIGQGGFGCVFKAKHKIDGWYYAIKMIELKVPLSKNLMEHKVIKEVKTMMKLNHKNVVRYTTCWFQLQIGRIESLLEASAMMSESNIVMSLSKSKSMLLSTNKNPMNKKKKNKEILNEISENEEKSSSQSIHGFNWNDQTDSLILKKDKTESVLFINDEEDKINNRNNSKSIDDDKNNNTPKALSVSFEKNRENDSIDDISDSDYKNSLYNIDKAKDDSQIFNSNSFLHKTKNHKEPIYKVYFFMQMEFCDGLSLNQFLDINKEKGLNRETIYNFFKHIVSGVNHIHKNNVIHRDLKPHNIFIFGKNSVKIGDFGLATELSSKERHKTSSYYNINYNHQSLRDSNPSNNSNLNITYDSIKLTEFVGTPLYQSPEQIDGLHYNEKVDIFAMGLILYEMCSSFKTGMERRESLESLKNEHVISSHIKLTFPSESFLILWMTNKKPSDRPSASAIIESEIFAEWKSQIEAIKISM